MVAARKAARRKAIRIADRDGLLSGVNAFVIRAAAAYTPSAEGRDSGEVAT
jgi:hypothetical protein